MLDARDALPRAYPRGHGPVSRNDAAKMVEGPFSELTMNDESDWRPVVDGVDLLERVTTAEHPHVLLEREQRDLEGFDPAYWTRCLLKRGSFLGSVGSADGESDEKTLFFDCACGCDGCWPLLASIFAFSRHVVWANFEQHHRDWILDLGPFVFERSVYEERLRGVLEEPTLLGNWGKPRE